MTYRRLADSTAGAFAAAVSETLRRLGRAVASGAAGVSASRLEQCANPMRGDSPSLAAAYALDGAMLAAGGGQPLLDAWLKRARAAGRPDIAGGWLWRARLATLAAATRAALALIDQALTQSLEPAERVERAGRVAA